MYTRCASESSTWVTTKTEGPELQELIPQGQPSVHAQRPLLHRRAHSIIGAGDLELSQILKHKTLEELASELVIKSRALEESQEEIELAARIGQTLLQRNQELDFEVESRTMALQNHAEHAAQEVKVLENKLSSALAQIRSLELGKSRVAIESEQLTQDVEDMRMCMTSMKAEIVKAHAKMERQRKDTLQIEEELELANKQILEYERLQSKLQDNLIGAKERIHELESSERFNMELITRLEIENQSICQQNHNQERKARQLLVERETMTSRVASQRSALRDHEIRQAELQETILKLQTEIQDLRETIKEEQLRGMQLSSMNQELEEKLEKYIQREEEIDSMPEGIKDLSPVRRKSLFYELSLQLKSEMRATCDKNNDITSESPRRSRNNSEGEEEPQTKTIPVTDTSVQVSQDPSNSEDILKEFFLLTAAAVKTAGGGFQNDTCNILNEDLYEEAMLHGITFDKFHQWLETRLEGTWDIQAALHHHRACENQCCAT